jgi:hypothetical protein
MQKDTQRHHTLLSGGLSVDQTLSTLQVIAELLGLQKDEKRELKTSS